MLPSFRSLAFSLALAGGIAAQFESRCPKYTDAAVQAAQVLQDTYFGEGGHYGDQAVWINAIDAFYLLSLDEMTGGSDYQGVINTVFEPNWDYLLHGESYDDVQWVSIAYLRSGNLENSTLFYDIAGEGADTSYCGGGVFWSGDRDYKNAITSELFMSTSGYLYDATGNAGYLTNLTDTWTWLNGSEMRGDNGLFNDGLTQDGTCANNGQTQWTYNQGTLLVGLGYLYKSGEQSALQDAFNIIDDIIDNLTVDDGLREACDDPTQSTCNSDQDVFKGIATYFIAWFLSIVETDNGTKYSDFLKLQGDKILENAADPDTAGAYGSVWYAKEADVSLSASSQSAALAGLIAAGMQPC